MSRTVTIGPYSLVTDVRGIRIERPSHGQGADVRAHLTILLIIDGQAPAPFTIQRIVAHPNDGKVEVHGYTTDAISFDGTLTHEKHSDGMKLAVQIVNTGPEVQARFAIHLELTGEADPEWFIPGLFYNENKVRDCQAIYPCYSEIHRDAAKFISNHWSFRSDRTGLPLVVCQTLGAVGFLAIAESARLGVAPAREIGPTSVGLGIEEGFPVLRAEVPYAEEPAKFSLCRPTGSDPEELYAPLETNQPLALTYHVGLLPRSEGARSRVYRGIYREWWGVHPPRPKVSSFGAQDLAIEGLVSWHLDEQHRIIHERSAFDKHFAQFGSQVELPQMHVGWQSGVLPAYVLLWHGRDTTNPNHVRAGTGVIDHIAESIAPCGTLWSLLLPEEAPAAGGGPVEGLIHARTVAEASLFLLRALRLEMQANTMHPRWYAAMGSTLNFAVQNQAENGALPVYWNAETGEVHSYDGSSGLCWVGALAAANHLFASNAYLEAAIRAGDYYAKFVENGFLYGSIEDLPLVPTADDCHLALISYMLLYEADRNPRWLELAAKSADLALTYRMAWNVTFAPHSQLANAGFQTRGGDIASPATPVLTANGLISYGEMLKLSALTGDPYYGERAREGRTFATQLLARVDGEFNARRGQAIGQLFHMDWWQPKGMFLSLSYAWTLGLVAHAELLEMHLSIPHAALTGDAKSVVEAASRTSVVELQKDLMLPESAEALRQSRASRTSTGIRPPSGAVEPVASQRGSQTIARPGAAPRVPTPSGTVFPKPPSSSPAVRRLPAASSTGMAKLPPASTPGVPKLVPLAKEPPSERSIFPFEPAAGAKVPPISPPKLVPKPKATESTHKPPDEISKQKTDQLDRSKLPIIGMMPASSQQPAKPAEVPRASKPQISRLEMPESAKPASGSSSHWENSPPSRASAPISEKRTADLPSLPPPPPGMGSGLLANLFEEDNRPRFTPLDRRVETPAPVNKDDDKSSFSLENDSEGGSGALPGSEAEDRADTDGIKIKWKIF